MLTEIDGVERDLGVYLPLQPRFYAGSVFPLLWWREDPGNFNR
ncbi:hypothetical protein ACFL02_10380 [Planctomycetota bacterium]